MKISFWNINNNKTAMECLSDLMVSASVPTIIGFAEYWKLNAEEKLKGNVVLDPISGRVGLICSSSVQIESVELNKYYMKCQVNIEGITVIVFVVHFRSKIDSEYSSESINRQCCRDIRDSINEISDNVGCIVMGDFNLPSYDEIFWDFNGLNVTNYLDNDSKKVFDGRESKKLYSPFTSLVGDLSNGVPGSYYYVIRHQSQAWHLYDQILLTYDLAMKLDRHSVGIVTEISGKSLLNANGRPCHLISDHLPLTLSTI